MVAVYIILACISPALLAILAWFILSLRKTASGGKEITKMRQELDAMRRDYAQLKADHTDMLLGLNATVQRLENRLDQVTGIEAPPPEPGHREPPQRQL